MKKVLIGLMLLFGGMALCPAQSLDEVVRLAQDSAITSFQNQYEYEYYRQRHAQFEALRKPQLTLDVVPNYLRMVNDLSRYYVYIRNFDRFSTAAQIKLSQKVLGLGGEAYVGSQAIWSEYLRKDLYERPRDFAVAPLILGYQQPLLGYNAYRWEKAVEDERLEAARKEHDYELHRIAEEATRRFFRLACAQGLRAMSERNKETADTLYAIAKEKAGIAMVTLAELRSLELQRLNAANALLKARNEEELARESLLAYLRIEEDSPLLGSTLTVPHDVKPLDMTDAEALQLARSNHPALQHRQAALTEARHQQEKARREAGVKVGVDLNVGMQQMGGAFGEAYASPQFYMLGAVTVSVPILDHGAGRKGYAAAQAWKAREEQALREEERALREEVLTTLENLRSHQRMLEHTAEAVTMADEVFQLTADNYANGVCDINTYSLAQSRRDNAYNQHLSALAEYWTTYYHLLTLTLHE